MGSSVSANPSRLSLSSNCWQLARGRTLAYEFYGDPSGEPVIYFHSHTSSRLAGSYFHASALQNGIRLISIDRPGTGRSDYVMQENLSDSSRDVIEVADQLEFAEF